MLTETNGSKTSKMTSSQEFTEIVPGVKITTKYDENVRQILTPEAANFLAKLQREFNPNREKLLTARIERQKKIIEGERPQFLAETKSVRESEWKVASAPKDLNDRRVEITGPVERKMMINALNSGAKVFMADFEDANSPTWQNAIEGQINCKEAIRKTLQFTSPDGKQYSLKPTTATLVIRPRGWHLLEKHMLVDGKPMSGSLFDFGLYFFHNAVEAVQRGTGPYFYLPKMESHLEARLWNDVFKFAQKEVGVPQGTIRATVLIETILAAYEMEEILFELKEHMAGLNAGRWDYIFSAIKKFRNEKSAITPDRAQITMTVPFMRQYTELLVRTCHKRGAHAIGGMAAFIPSRKDAKVNEIAMAKVREDKEREAADGFDGTWVAHPDLVAIAQEKFDAVLGTKPNQKDRLRPEVQMNTKEVENNLINFNIPNGKVTENGVRLNINVALQYIERWVAGLGAVAIHNLMEDAATAEISRAQLWQWVHHKVALDTCTLDEKTYERFCAEEVQKLAENTTVGMQKYSTAVQILNSLVMGEWKHEFLTIPAYEFLY